MNDDSSSQTDERLLPLGRLLFGAGVILLTLRGLEFARQMPGLPSFWYANQPLWLVVGAGMTGLGWRVLWRSPQPEPQRQSWHPTIPGRRFLTATLYVGEGCHLCDDATAVLQAYEKWLPVVQEIDIRSEPKLVEQFGTCIPVLVLDGKVRFRGKIQETLLRRLIEGTHPSNSGRNSQFP